MRSYFVRPAFPLATLLLAACDDGTRLSPARVHAVTITTPVERLIAPQRIPLPGPFAVRVDADPGVATDVRWTSSDTGVLAIDAERVAHFCTPGTVTLTATAIADTMKSSSVTLQVGRILLPFASITSLTDAVTDAPIDVNAVRGEVLVETSIDSALLACMGLARVELMAIDAGNVGHTIASRDFSPAVHAYAPQRFRWNTAELPEGAYRLQFYAWIAGRESWVELAERPVIVRH